MKVRAALPVDSKPISKLICELVTKFITKGFSSSGGQFLLNTMTPDSIERYMQTGYRYHVAEMDAKLVGVIGIRDNVHLYHLFVAERYQRQGLAKKLWQFAMEVSLRHKKHT